MVESGILGWIFRANDIFTDTKYNTLYLGLATGLINESGTNITDVEVTGLGYVRTGLANDSTTWYAATTGVTPAVKYNKTEINFPNPDSDWGTVTHYFISATGTGNGELVTYGSIMPPKVINMDEPVKFEISGLYITVH